MRTWTEFKSSLVETRSVKGRLSQSLAVVLSMATLFGTIPVPVYALPSGQQVVHGDVSFNINGNNMTITAGDKVIINYDIFSIGANEMVKFLQAGTQSVALNRVIGNNMSEIYGQLQANGNIILVNPHGILFGPGSQVNVHGLIASTLDISNENFLNDNYVFVGETGSVQNLGQITADTGGHVILIAPEIVNDGSIEAPEGEVILAADSTYFLSESLGSHVAVQLQTGGNVVNSGQILADAGAVGIYAKAVQQSGDIQANALS
ncbi:MAG: filamentous hemagglutinin N-terminal domain-containing protein, partial [Planctomycetota bacterium]|nr:filamentous hemagglutinin N-terminal domain-containing protein [Planctomycetota bacterium]